jgi:hypothetical protein
MNLTNIAPVIAWAQRDFRAATTLIILPPGDDSRYVPLVSLGWHFYISASIGTQPNANGSYATIVVNPGPRVGDPTMTDKFPEWSTVDFNGPGPV